MLLSFRKDIIVEPSKKYSKNLAHVNFNRYLSSAHAILMDNATLTADLARYLLVILHVPAVSKTRHTYKSNVSSGDTKTHFTI